MEIYKQVEKSIEFMESCSIYLASRSVVLPQIGAKYLNFVLHQIYKQIEKSIEFMKSCSIYLESRSVRLPQVGAKYLNFVLPEIFQEKENSIYLIIRRSIPYREWYHTGPRIKYLRDCIRTRNNEGFPNGAASRISKTALFI